MSAPLVLAVAPGSPADRAGLRPGDELRALNGEVPRDIIRYQILVDDPDLEIDVSRGGLDLSIGVQKGAGEPLGVEVESAVFDADHRLGAGTLVARARAARADRPSILGDDALGWALARSGRCDEARTWSERSLRLGTQDALLFFHRAEIERCAGDRVAARRWARKALALDPAFSVRWAPAARRLAA